MARHPGGTVEPRITTDPDWPRAGDTVAVRMTVERVGNLGTGDDPQPLYVLRLGRSDVSSTGVSRHRLAPWRATADVAAADAELAALRAALADIVAASGAGTARLRAAIETHRHLASGPASRPDGAAVVSPRATP